MALSTTLPSGRPGGWLGVAAVLAGIVLVPLGLRAVNARLPSAGLAPSFIPSIESPRVRLPFDHDAVASLKESRPDYVVIGDSMAGTRINAAELSRRIGGRSVAPILQSGSASAYWYLAFKNFVVNARIAPRAVIFFFRDENLTAPLLRVYPTSLDRVAYDHEAALDRVLAANLHGPMFRLHLAAEQLYGYSLTRDWLERRLTAAPLGLTVPEAGRESFLKDMNERLFPLESLRPMVAADLPEATDVGHALDFDRRLEDSLLPEIIRLSQQSGIRVAFIRVQRRPGPDGPPVQSDALRRYMRKLSTWLAKNGAYFHDDWGDPEQPLRIYEDGDHVARDYRTYYTALFVRRNPELFQ